MISMNERRHGRRRRKQQSSSSMLRLCVVRCLIELWSVQENEKKSSRSDTFFSLLFISRYQRRLNLLPLTFHPYGCARLIFMLINRSRRKTGIRDRSSADPDIAGVVSVFFIQFLSNFAYHGKHRPLLRDLSLLSCFSREGRWWCYRNKRKQQAKCESNISRERGRENKRTVLYFVRIIISYIFFSEKMDAFRASFSPRSSSSSWSQSFLSFFLSFFIEHTSPSVRRIRSLYRLERVVIHVHSFFMITPICSHLRQKSSLSLSLSVSFQSLA